MQYVNVLKLFRKKSVKNKPFQNAEEKDKTKVLA